MATLIWFGEVQWYDGVANKSVTSQVRLYADQTMHVSDGVLDFAPVNVNSYRYERLALEAYRMATHDLWAASKTSTP